MAGAELGAALRHVHRIFGGGCAAGLTDAELLERFSAGRDEAAFAALVARHGPMVLAVCRGVLKDMHDAEDAFQATFLILVRKAGSIWLTGSLGSWLYRVAYRVSVQANRVAARRRTRERQGVEMDVAGRAAGGDRPELRPALHEEIARLPGKYRAAVVLCYFEGLTREQAADRLRLPAGTVGSRLARGRGILRDRLRRRGLTLTGPVLGAAIARESKAAVPDAWVGATIRAAADAGAGRAAAVALTEEVLRTMTQANWKFAAFALVGAGALALAAGAALVERAAPAATHARVVEAPTPVPDDDTRGTIEIRGRVVDPEGKPFAGAAIYVRHRDDAAEDAAKASRSVRVAASDADGRFRFPLDKSASDWPYSEGPAWGEAKVAAVAPGYGPAWIDAGEAAKAGEPTLRLVRDDVPIRGRLLDSQGRPLAGVAVRVSQIGAIKDGVDLDAILASGVFEYGNTAATYWDPSWLGTGSTWTTDADGRFEIKGVGRDRVVAIETASPSVEKTAVYAMARPSKVTPKPRPRPSRPGEGMRMIGRPPAPRLFGATFDQVAGPTRPIAGVVRIRGTGEPVAGVRVSGAEPATWTRVGGVTDARGRFRLVGLPKAESYVIDANPSPGTPYLAEQITVTDTEGLGPIEAVLEVPGGVVVKGRLVDGETGKVVPPMQVMHIKLPSNTAPGDSHGQARISPADGSFVMTVPPGEGCFAASARGGGGLYARARLAKADKGRGVGGFDDKETIMFPLGAMNAYKIVDVPADARDFAVDLGLIRAPGRKGKVVDPDGRPIAGTEAYGLVGTWGKIKKLEGDSFEVGALEPGHPRRLSFTHKGRKLAGSIVVGDAELKSESPLVARLVPIGTIKGRLIDDDGLPLAGASIGIAYYDLEGSNLPLGQGGVWPTDETVAADAEGRFEFAGIVPGLDTSLGIEVKSRPRERFTADRLWKRFTPGSNATIDLGDVKVKAEPN